MEASKGDARVLLQLDTSSSPVQRLTGVGTGCVQKSTGSLLRTETRTAERSVIDGCGHQEETAPSALSSPICLTSKRDYCYYTAEYVLHEPPYDRQPSDPVGVLRDELARRRDNINTHERLLLLKRCIEWLTRSLSNGTVESSQESNEAMEEWLCEECELERIAAFTLLSQAAVVVPPASSLLHHQPLSRSRRW